eukprot:m.186058 g.186058  ORF g.186058 m.186058 type:complete len:92 (+) comp32252_c0_seq3:678-953(+)
MLSDRVSPVPLVGGIRKRCEHQHHRVAFGLEHSERQSQKRHLFSQTTVMETVQVLMNMFATLRGYKPGALLKSALTAIQEKAADLDAQCDS